MRHKSKARIFNGLILIIIFATISYAKGIDLKKIPKPEEWVGEKVIFRPRPEILQKYGYASYSYSKGNSLQYPSYFNLVEKTAIIEKVTRDFLNINVVLKIEDSNKLLYTKANGNTLESIGFFSEMEKAKKYIGKTVWNKKNKLQTYNPDEYLTPKIGIKGKYEEIPIKNLEKLTVVKIEWGWFTNPLRFYLKTKDGKVGFWDGSYSRINDTFNNLLEPFDENWYLQNPYKIHPSWDKKTWKAIEKNKIYIGMNKEMVLMSWGKPKDINRTVGSWGSHEQWGYDSQYLYFENNKLTSFQD